jgi:cystathionine beta-lyase
LHWKSQLLHPSGRNDAGYKSLVYPVYRGSTVLFDRQAQVVDDWDQRNGYTYGLYGTPTAVELAAQIASLEGALHSLIVPGGQAAIALIYLAFCRAGSHALVPASAYGPNQEMAQGLLAGLGIEVEPYDPLIGAGIARLIRPETALIWVESPGSVTMEVQDIPAIVAAARERAVTVAADNTYAAGVLLDVFGMGVDVSMQALTKYVGGHSDLILGSVSAAHETALAALGSAYKQLGLAVSPEDCALALRGLQTLAIRLERLERSTMAVADWLEGQPAVETIFHPAFPSCPGHDVWKRDFRGSASVFSFLVKPQFEDRQVEAFVDALRLFRIGFSWGGIHSLAIVYPGVERPGRDFGGRLVRLNVGLEEPADLIADLQQAMRVFGAVSGADGFGKRDLRA